VNANGLSTEEQRAVRRAVVHFNAQAWGVSFGLLCGLGLMIATLVLVAKGGPNVGEHLNLLGNYLPGYRVTMAGAFLGFVYGMVLGYILGRLIGVVYNTVVSWERR
jgi:hypothetical protein